MQEDNSTDVYLTLMLKNEQHLNVDQNFDPQMSLSKSKCWLFKQLFTFFKCAVRLCCITQGSQVKAFLCRETTNVFKTNFLMYTGL